MAPADIMDAAWSPDGSKIAIVSDQHSTIDPVVVYIADRDGENLRALVDTISGRQALAWSPEMLALGIGSCSISATVPTPDAPPGLLQDCEALLNARDVLAYSARPLNWSYEVPINEWEGVTFTGSQLRVTRLELPASAGRRGLSGPIPTALGNLPELWRLDLSDNDLTGSIPPELGNLTELGGLDLSGNDLSGSLPPELGNLTKLTRLSLSDNGLTGSLPPELGNLTWLWGLDLSHNGLTGSLRPELGNLTKLEDLSLSHNGLTGSLPPELGNLTELEDLSLSHNGLTGSLPPELGNLTELGRLDLSGNDLSGCVPVELREIWVEASGLERCEPEGGPGQ